MSPEEVAAKVAAYLEDLDSIAKAEAHGSEVNARTQGGVPFRVLVLWPDTPAVDTTGTV